MDVAAPQETTAQKEEEDQISELLKYYDPGAPPSRSEIERIKKNKLNVDYYRANKEKIAASKKLQKAASLIPKCIEEKIPDHLASYIKFRSNGEVHFVFKDSQEARKILHWIKFKAKFGEEIIL